MAKTQVVEEKTIDSGNKAYDPWAEDTALVEARKSQRAALERQRATLESQLNSMPGYAPSMTAMGMQFDPYGAQRAALQSQISGINSQITNLSMQAEGRNPDGSPIAPGWRTIVDPQTGKLRSTYQLELAGLDPSQWQGYSQWKQEALRAPGTQSAWAQIQMQKQAAEEQAARDAAARQAMSSQSAAMSQLAMRGGVGSGASTRLASQMGKELMAQRQAAARQGILSRLGISSEDEAARQRSLAGLAQSETDIGKVNKEIEGKVGQYNLQNLLKEVEGRRAWEQEQYKEKMRAWASEKQAQATESGGGGGGGK